MSPHQLRTILLGLDDSTRLVFVVGDRDEAPGGDPLELSCRAALREAAAAYRAWRTTRSRAAYAVYRACADRADAAQDALAASHRTAG